MEGKVQLYFPSSFNYWNQSWIPAVQWLYYHLTNKHSSKQICPPSGSSSRFAPHTREASLIHASLNLPEHCSMALQCNTRLRGPCPVIGNAILVCCLKKPIPCFSERPSQCLGCNIFSVYRMTRLTKAIHILLACAMSLALGSTVNSAVKAVFLVCPKNLHLFRSIKNYLTLFMALLCSSN